jgi:hypothetical protein
LKETPTSPSSLSQQKQGNEYDEKLIRERADDIRRTKQTK